MGLQLLPQVKNRALIAFVMGLAVQVKKKFPGVDTVNIIFLRPVSLYGTLVVDHLVGITAGIIVKRLITRKLIYPEHGLCNQSLRVVPYRTVVVINTQDVREMPYFGSGHLLGHIQPFGQGILARQGWPGQQ